MGQYFSVDTRSMHHVLLHNLSLPYAYPAPGLFDFDQNALFFANSGDVVVTRKQIDRDYLTFLSEIGLFSPRIALLYSKSHLDEKPDALFRDEALHRNVQDLISDESSLDTFVYTDAEHAWARAIGLSTRENSGQYKQFSTKSSFRVRASESGLRVPLGFTVQSSGAIAFRAALLFFCGFSQLILKHDDGMAGLGSVFLGRNIKDWVFQPVQRNLHLQLSDDGPYVLEGWYERVLQSPSVQLYVSDTSADLLSVHVQTFETNRVTYKGCFSHQWIHEPISVHLKETAQRFADTLRVLGYRGHMSLNAIVLDDDRVLWNEVNPRRVMSSYPAHIASGVSFEGIHYGTTSITKAHWRGKRIGEVLHVLKSLLFTPSLHFGIVPYNYGLLASRGTLSVMAIGETKEDVTYLLDHVATL